MKVLFVDDDCNRWNMFKQNNPTIDAERVKFVEDATNILSKQKFDILCLDHDMDDPPFRLWLPNGTDLAKYIVENKIECKMIFLHSMNDEGRARMLDILTKAGYNVVDNPLLWETDILMELLKNIEILAKDRQQFKKERNEARKEICESTVMIIPNDEGFTGLNPRQIANYRGWDCYWKED
jgi:DNA-binding NtrC family response regulator